MERESAIPSALACPRCGELMETGIVATTGVVAWQQKRTRLLIDGEVVGKRLVATTPNYRGWRCRGCQLILFDHSRAV